MWIAVGALVLLPIVAYGVLRLFFWEGWTLFRIQWYTAAGRYERALPLLEQKLERLRRKHGENHLDTTVAKFGLGEIHFKHGRTAEGLRLVDEATTFFNSYSGPRDKVLWVHLLNLGVAQRSVGLRDLAIETFRKAMELERELHGPDTEEMAKAANNLAATLEESGRAAESLPIYEELLSMFTKRRGAESIEAAKIHVNLAEANISLEQWAAAQNHIQTAVHNMKLAPMHVLGNAYDTYARLAEARDSLSEAEQMRMHALTALKQGLGETNVEVAIQMEKLASLLERMKRNTECDLFRKKAAAIRAALA